MGALWLYGLEEEEKGEGLPLFGFAFHLHLLIFDVEGLVWCNWVHVAIVAWVLKAAEGADRAQGCCNCWAGDEDVIKPIGRRLNNAKGATLLVQQLRCLLDRESCGGIIVG